MNSETDPEWESRIASYEADPKVPKCTSCGAMCWTRYMPERYSDCGKFLSCDGGHDPTECELHPFEGTQSLRGTT